jgi:hypothetical protein
MFLKIWYYTWQRTPFRNPKNQDLFEVNADPRKYLQEENTQSISH